MGNLTPLRVVAIGGVATLVAAVAFFAWQFYVLIRPQTLTVENRTDAIAAVYAPTFYRLDLGPQSSGKIDTGWFPFNAETIEIYSIAGTQTCDWDQARKERLIIDESGASCAE